jgi:hypothetical protein
MRRHNNVVLSWIWHYLVVCIPHARRRTCITTTWQTDQASYCKIWQTAFVYVCYSSRGKDLSDVDVPSVGKRVTRVLVIVQH